MTKPTIAIFGSNGALGAPTIAAFESETFKDKVQAPVSVFTRSAAGKTNSDVIQYVEGDLSADPEGIAEKVKNIDVIISLLTFSPEVSEAIEKVVSIAKPKLYIPSQFGSNVVVGNQIFPGFLAGKDEHSQKLRSQGIKVVDIHTSVFVGGPWVYEINGHFGLDTASKSVTYLGSPDAEVSFTHTIDIGRTIAAVATKDPAELPDRLDVRSGTISAAQVVKLWETRHNTTLDVKAIIPKEQALAEAKEEWNKNGFVPEKFMYYLNVLIANGSEAGLLEGESGSEFINPGESLWTWEKF